MRNGKIIPSNGEWPEIMKPDEAARYLRMSRKTFDKALHQGRIPHTRFGRCILIPKAALDELIESARDLVS